MMINIKSFMKKFQQEYDFLHENRDAVAGMQEAVDEFDERMSDEKFAGFVGEFARFRGDFISSDREAAAFMFALEG